MTSDFTIDHIQMAENVHYISIASRHFQVKLQSKASWTEEPPISTHTHSHSKPWSTLQVVNRWPTGVCYNGDSVWLVLNICIYIKGFSYKLAVVKTHEISHCETSVLQCHHCFRPHCSLRGFLYPGHHHIYSIVTLVFSPDFRCMNSTLALYSNNNKVRNCKTNILNFAVFSATFATCTLCFDPIHRQANESQNLIFVGIYAIFAGLVTGVMVTMWLWCCSTLWSFMLGLRLFMTLWRCSAFYMTPASRDEQF